MGDNLLDHYRALLGLTQPWTVQKVSLDIKNKKVTIELEHATGCKVLCPECGKSYAAHDKAPVREWRHLDTMQFETVLIARVPRCKCPECGPKTIEVPWAGKYSRFTLMFEAFAIDVLTASSSVEAARQLLGLDWDALNGIMKRAVERGLLRRDAEPVKHLGVDEKSFRKGQNYISVLNDLDAGRVLDVVEGRTEENAKALFATLSEDQRDQVEAIALDMWKAYINAAKQAFPEADLVHDKFHISKYLGEAVNKVRAQEIKVLHADGDNRLDGTRWIWQYNEENLKERYHECFDALRNQDLKTGRAWSIKECFRWFWEPHLTREEAEEYFKKWYGWAIRSRLEPIKSVARMLKNHLEELLNWCDHHITNAVSEGLNSRIQSIKSAARGFHKFENYRVRILFYCGQLELYPVSH